MPSTIRTELPAQSRWAQAAIVLLALLGLAAALTTIDRRAIPASSAPRPPGVERRAALPPSAPPLVPPTVLIEETPDLARESNAKVPIVASALMPASPFRYAGKPGDLARAEACLAAAQLYEAGDDAVGQRAVAQVVLNRLRHPAFPKTVCGVIFQGSERRTGCQFTFTCDGSLARSWPSAAWDRARRVARAALSGRVDKAVGTATHYHADYVVPYWRDGLTKIAMVHTHIFYRWPGHWGSRAALAGRAEPGEVLPVALARWVDVPLDPVAAVEGVETVAPVPPALKVEGVPAAALKGAVVRLKDENAGQFVVQLDQATPPASYAVIGYTLCGEKLECMVFGWTREEDIPRSLPVTPRMMQSMVFAYRRSKTLGLAQGYWDCHRFPRANKSECFTD